MFGETDLKAYKAADAQAQAQLMAQAQVRALVSRSNLIRGQGTVAWMRAGYFFTLSQKNYQILTVNCNCNCCDGNKDIATLSRAVDFGFNCDTTREGYNNSFTCHSLDLGPFAPEISVQRPVLGGLTHATICADGGTSGYADLDNLGRYKANLHFPEAVYDAGGDLVDADKVPVPLRLMQPHAGAASGVHLPLRKDAEVLVAFTDGDPDRPVILGALPNPANPSLITSSNNKDNILKTPGGHQLLLADEEGKRQIKVTTADGKSAIRLIE
jgi:type VI secretion system secreted protein VgrG